MKRFSSSPWNILFVTGLICSGCGTQHPLTPQGEISSARLTKPAGQITPKGWTDVVVTVLRDGTPVEGVEVAFSRSVSGLSPDYKWRGKGKTNKNGQTMVEITAEGKPFWRARATGYYLAQAVDANSGKAIGQWRSIPINDGETVDLILEIGRQARFALPAIEFVMRAKYALGERIDIRIRNISNTSYLYTVCPGLNLAFYDDSGESHRYVSLGKERPLRSGQFITPEELGCDIGNEAEIKPGSEVLLMTWTQNECTKDELICVEHIPVKPGKYTIVGMFSESKGWLLGMTGIGVHGGITVARTRFIIE